MLGACAALVASAPSAQADVFEIGSDGQWGQIGEIPSGLPSGLPQMPLDSDAAAQEKLPPVRLAAITTISGQPTEQADARQAVIIGTAPATGQFGPLINAAATQYGISPALVEAVMWQESRYNHKAISSAGAIGLMQLMPGTARSLGVNPYDPWQNVFGGAAYLRTQLDRFGNNVPLALAAYNAGPEAVAKYGGVPPYAETRNYVSVIMRRLMSRAQ